MSNKPAIQTIGNAVRAPAIPYKRIFKDLNRYNRKAKHRKGWED